MPWSLLPLSPPPGSPAVLAEILDGGQAFRWHGDTMGTRRPRRVTTPEWIGQWGGHVIRVRWHRAGIEWKSENPAPPRTEPAVRAYFAADVDFDDLTDRLPWRSDSVLAAARDSFPGLRLLRQPFGETLLAFLCSATKQIVQIKQMLALLAERHGAPLAGSRYHRLPTWAELAAIPESDLRRCLLGFRARHIAGTARFLAERPGWLEDTEALPYAEAKARLCELPGVGEKIADCVLLFGAGRLEAFPVDVWILRALANRYGLTGWKPAQVAQFGRLHFGPAAGLAQQLLFARERSAPGEPMTKPE